MGLPKFIVFLNGRGEEGKLVSVLEEAGFAVLVDAVHGSSREFFEAIKGSWRAYYFSKDTLCRTEVSENMAPPDFMIVFDEGQVWVEEDMELVDKWVHNVVNVYADSKIDVDLDKVYGILQKAVKLVVEGSDMDLFKKDEIKYYDLRMKKISKGMLYEVTKPYTDLPYVTLSWNFEKTGHLDFFTSLFVATSWGVCSDDVAFLKLCWEKMEMEGVFDLDEMLKARIERCKAGEVEPRVWRNTLENVEGMLSDIIEKKRRIDYDGVVKKVNKV